MDRDAFVGNITTIGKFILLATGTPSLVSFASSNDYIILISAIFGVVWAFYDSKYFNTFFKRNAVPVADEYSDGLNPEYTTGDEDE